MLLRCFKQPAIFVFSQLRGTNQTVSLNICSEDLLSPTIFGLKCDQKWMFSSHFRDMGKVMPVYFVEIKMSFWVR